MKREIALLRGRVQAVGFRDTVLSIARRHPVAGSVSNLRAGERLEIDVEGEDAAVDAFLDEILANPPRYARIEAVERRTAEPTGATGFVRGATR